MAKTKDYLYEGTIEEFNQNSNDLINLKVFKPAREKLEKILKEMENEPEDRDNFLKTNMSILMAALSTLDEEYKKAVVEDDEENETEEIPKDVDILTQPIVDTMQSLTQISVLMFCASQLGYTVKINETTAEEIASQVLTNFGESLGARGLVRLAKSTPVKSSELKQIGEDHLKGLKEVLSRSE